MEIYPVAGQDDRAFSLHLNHVGEPLSTVTPLPDAIPSPAPQPPPAHSLPPIPANLTRELPVVNNDLIPLPLLIERLVGQAHADLLNLTETLPSSSDAVRKRAIVDYVLQTRRQLLKLLVLVRWSSQADKIATCMSIIGFLARQNYEFDHSISSLTEVKSMLATARVRNYDLATSLSVLTTGTYTRLPSLIQQNFTAPEKLSDESVLETLEELNQTLRWRLACVEILPKQMKNYWIADGRATFRVDNMWEASFTYGGDNESDTAEWFLLSLKFLFRVKDNRAMWSNTPTGASKDHILELCNRELLKRRGPPEAVTGKIESGKQESFDRDAKLSQPNLNSEIDSPLTRGFNFLQQLALIYQMEAIHLQALQLANSHWNGQLKSEFTANRSQLTINYWSGTPQPAAVNSRRVQTQRPSGSHSLIFSIGNRQNPVSATGRGRNRAFLLERALQPTMTSENETQELHVEWITADLNQETKSSLALKFDRNLDLGGLLNLVTRTHANFLAERLFEELSENDMEERIKWLTETEQNGPRLEVHLWAHHYITAHIDPTSGRLQLSAVGEVNPLRETRLRAAAEKIDRDVKIASDTIARIRASTILDEIDFRCHFLGLQTFRRLPLRNQDLLRFGTQTKLFLFVQLDKQLQNFHLVFVLLENHFEFCLIETEMNSDGVQNWQSIKQLAKIGREFAHKEDKFDVSIDELRVVHSYCVRRACLFRIEEQFHQRGIQCQTISSTLDTTNTPTVVTQPSPYLVVQTQDLMKNSPPNLTFANLAIQCFVRNSALSEISFHVRFKQPPFTPSAARLPESIQFDKKTKMVKFSFETVEGIVPKFLSAYAFIIKTIVTRQHQEKQEKDELATSETKA